MSQAQTNKKSQKRHKQIMIMQLFGLQASNGNNRFDLVKELMNSLITIIKSFIIFLLSNHIQGYTQYRFVSLMFLVR